MRKIAVEDLIDHDACEEHVERFKARYPHGVVPTVEECEQVAGLFDFKWAAEHLLTDDELAQFERLQRAAKADWDDAVLPLAAADRAVREPAQKEYLEAGPQVGWQEAWKVFQDATFSTHAAWTRAQAIADQVYDLAIARAFGTIWCQENTK